MIKFDSNIDKVIKSYQKAKKDLPKRLADISYLVAQEIANDFKVKLDRDRSTWYRAYEGTSIVDGYKHINVIKTDTGARIEVGSKGDMLIMKDGSIVNPYYFIEFGFGIDGQINSARGASEHGWEYNVNGHTTYWWYTGTAPNENGGGHATTGRSGINFIYNTLDEYKRGIPKRVQAQINNKQRK